MEKNRGSLTVEAAIVLPVFILFVAFIVNFMNIFYMQLAVHQGLSNAANTLAQYGYAVHVTVPGGMKNLALDPGTGGKVQKIQSGIDGFQTAAGEALAAFGGGISLARLPELVEKGAAFGASTQDLVDALRGVGGKDIANYLFSLGTEAGGGLLVEAMVDDYLTQMGVNRKLLDGPIRYQLLVDAKDGRCDLILTAEYSYRDSMFSLFFDRIPVEQSVVVHPWIGGGHPGLRAK